MEFLFFLDCFPISPNDDMVLINLLISVTRAFYFYFFLQHAHFPFIYCVEKLIYDGKKTEWETCFLKLGLDEKPVTDCYESGRGKEVSFLGLLHTTNLFYNVPDMHMTSICE